MDDFFLEMLDQNGLAYISDPLGNISWANDKLCAISGYRRSELLGKNTQVLSASNHFKELAEEIKDTIKKGNSWRGELRQRAKNGEYYWVDCLARAKHEPNGGTSIYYFQLDITAKKLAEEQVNFSHSNFQLLFENTRDIVAIIDTQGIYRYISPSATRISGYEMNELVGKNAFDFFHPDDIEYMKTESLLPALEGKDTSIEFRFRKKDGHYNWFEANTKTIYDPNTGEISGICTFSRDITESKKNKQKLIESMELYHSLVDNLPLSVWRKDSEGRLTYVNKTLVETIKIPESELLGKTNYDLYSRFDADKYAEDDAYVLSTGQPYKGTEHNINPVTEEKSYVETIKIPIRDAEGNVEGIQGVFWDITEVINATENILKSQRHFKKLVNRINEILLLSDGAGKITYCSESIQNILGYASENIVGTTLTDLFLDEDLLFISNLLTSASHQQGSIVSAELKIRNSEGMLRWVELSVGDYTSDLDIKAFIVNIKDIHSQKKAAENIRYQANLLQEVSDAIISTDENFAIVSWNKAAEKTYGHLESAAIGQLIQDLIPTEFLDTDMDTVMHTFRTNGLWEGEVLQTTKSGQKIYILSSVSAIRDEHGNFSGAIAVNRNITDKKEAEKMLRLQNEQLTEIAWLHSHKIRGPVATIMGLMNIYDWDNLEKKGNIEVIQSVDQVIRQLDLIIHEVVKKTGELYQDKGRE